MAEHTIKSTFGIDTKPAEDGLRDIENKANRAAGTLGNLFAREPLGVRRGARAFEQLARGIAAIGDESTTAIGAITSFGRSLSVGIAGGAAIAGVGLLAERFLAVNEAALKMQESVQDIAAAGSTMASGFQPMEKLQSTFSQATAKSKELYEQIAKFEKGGVIGRAALISEATQRGMLPATLLQTLHAQMGEADKAASEALEGQVKKTKDLYDVEYKRLYVSQEAGELTQEEIRHKEALAVASSEEAQKKGISHELTDQENRLNELNTQHIKEAGQLRTMELNQAVKLAGATRELAEIAVSGLTTQEQQAAAARENLEIAGQQLQYAKERYEIEKNLGAEAERQAAARVQAAQAGATRAAAGVGAQAGAELERAGAEEAMTPSEKQAQYQQRMKQFYGLRQAAARRGINTELISSPQYGEAEYDPTAAYRGAVGREAEARTREAASPYAGLTMREILQRMPRPQLPAQPPPEVRPGYTRNVNTGEWIPLGPMGPGGVPQPGAAPNVPTGFPPGGVRPGENVPTKEEMKPENAPLTAADMENIASRYWA